jgi:sulfur carrier protein
MQIYINGESVNYDTTKTLDDIISSLGISIMGAAVNMVVIKKEKWRETIIQDGDRVELLSFVGGG